MQKLRMFLHIIDAISEWAGKITSFLIILIIGTMLTWVFFRYVFHANTAWNYTTATKFLFIYVLFGAAYALRYQAFVNVDILYRRFSLRARSIVDVATSTLFFLFCINFLRTAVEEAIEAAPRLGGFSFRLLSPLYWPAALLGPIGISLLLLQGSAKFIRDLVTATTGKELT